MNALALGLDRTILELKMYSREKESVFFSFLFPPPKRDIGGRILSMSVPVVLTCPSLKLLSMNFSVSSGLRCSLSMISFKSSALRRWTYSRHPRSGI